MIHILFVSFVAGMITVLAPCVLPVLPVILGGSLADQDKYRPRVIILSFACSILLFTLTLQWLVWTLWIQKNDLVMVSGVILGLFGLSLVFPQAREYFADRSGINRITRYTARSKHQGYIPDIILGLVLGPVFNTCSPTYSILVATILPVSFVWWLTNIVSYILWLCLMLGLIVIGWRSITNRLRPIADPHGWFKKIVGIMLIVVAIAIVTKTDKAIESWLIDQWYIINTTSREVQQTKHITN